MDGGGVVCKCMEEWTGALVARWMDGVGTVERMMDGGRWMDG